MVQEYLFTDGKNKEEIEKDSDKQGNIKLEIIPLKNSECWIAVFSAVGDNETSAKKLSELNEEFLKKYSPTVLTNDSSAYFNRRLFPYMNAFERKLRKLLYLKASLNPNEKSSKNIKDLERMDLGGLFDTLFADTEYSSTIKSWVKDRKTFTSNDISRMLSKLSEDCAWDHLIGPDAVQTFRSSFIDVRYQRNDVMHAHNINWKQFSESKNLIEKINAELDAEIEKTLGIESSHGSDTPIDRKESFNDTLYQAIQNTTIPLNSFGFSDGLSPFQQAIAGLTYPYDEKWADVQRRIAELKSPYDERFSEFQQVIAGLKSPYDERLSELQQQNAELKNIHNDDVIKNK